MSEIQENDQRFNVGGIMSARPFRIQRLGHFGLNFRDMPAALDFYGGLLGFKVSDTLDFRRALDDQTNIAAEDETRAFFTRIGSDHHCFVLMPDRVRRLMNPRLPSDMTINQITWQVSSLREVVDASHWFETNGVPISRNGRDTPGSNWHVYPVDPDGHTIELYYGIEQIGWDGLSKPEVLHRFGARRPPQLPHMPEYLEIADVVREGEDLASGTRSLETGPPAYDVGGVLLPRPFRVLGIGPVGLFVADVEASVRFYTDLCGLVVTEQTLWHGHTIAYLRAGTEHHTLVLYPLALRAELGWSVGTTCMSFGMRVNDYDQLKSALEFLQDAGVEIRHLPAELTAGIDYSAFAIDPEGHAVQLYFCMDQVGWDGRPRPMTNLFPGEFNDWPAAIIYSDHILKGEVFLGPWG